MYYDWSNKIVLSFYHSLYFDWLMYNFFGMRHTFIEKLFNNEIKKNDSLSLVPFFV